MKRNITIKDIAREAGVSTAVVSVALSNGRSNTRMSEQTRERIRAIARENNYHSNIIARGFQFRKSYLIGLFFSNQSWYIQSRILDELRKICYAHQYDIIVYSTDSLEMEKHSLEVARSRNLDAILTVPFASEEGNNLEIYRQFAASGVPVIQIFYRISPEFPYIGRDYFALGEKGIRLLAERGHRRIGLQIYDNYLDTCLGHNSFVFYRGCMEEARKASVNLTVYPVNFSRPDNPYPGEECAEKIFELPVKQRPTAILSSSNTLVFKAYERFREFGLSIPRDISLVGCADDFELNRTLLSKLSFYAVPFREIAAAAAGKCLALSDASPMNEILFDSPLSGEFTIRDISSAARNQKVPMEGKNRK